MNCVICGAKTANATGGLGSGKPRKTCSKKCLKELRDRAMKKFINNPCPPPENEFNKIVAAANHYASDSHFRASKRREQEHFKKGKSID